MNFCLYVSVGVSYCRDELWALNRVDLSTGQLRLEMASAGGIMTARVQSYPFSTEMEKKSCLNLGGRSNQTWA